MPERTWEETVAWLRAQPDQQDLVRACYFDDPLHDVAKRYQGSMEWSAVCRWLPQKPGHALDVGAGRGITSYALAKSNWKVTALEPDGSALVGAEAIRQLSREENLGIEVIEEQAEEMPFGDGRFDLVHARQVLHHAQDLTAFCAQMWRVLRPGGRLIATREHVIDQPDDLTRFQANHPLHQLYGGEMAYPLNAYLDALSKAGFRRIAVLGPFDSPINMPPDDSAAYRGLKGVANRMLRWCAKGGMLRTPVARICTRACRVPGRLYSFAMEKSGSCS